MAEVQRTDDQAEKVELHAPSSPPVTDHQRELATQAITEFEKGNYEQCNQSMSKLLSQRPNDPKVVHNKAVCEFYLAKSSNAQFRKSLTKVCDLYDIKSENSENVEDVDHGIIYYNQAVLLYRLHHYKTAILILDKLFQFIEPLEETLAKKVVFLLVELYLCTNQPEKAVGLLSYMEKALFNGGKAGVSSLDKDVHRDGKDNNSRDSKDNGRDKGDSIDEADEYDATKIRIIQYKARCYLMLKTLKSCKREIKLLSSVPSFQTTAFSYLKSNFEYIRGNYRKASKILNSTYPPLPSQDPNSGEDLTPVMYYSNLGTTHFHMRKHNLGSYFFSKALVENEKIIRNLSKSDTGKVDPQNFTMLRCTSFHYEMMFNIGIELLHCSKPVAAFDCLVEAVQCYQTNPRLWLRLAECCIMEHRQDSGLTTEEKWLSRSVEPVKGSIGSGVHRKLILGVGGENYSPRNALALLPDDPATLLSPVTEDLAEGSKLPETLSVPAPPGNPMRPTEVANLRCSILCAASYVSLCLHDFVPAISFAQKLLRQSSLSGAQRYLGKMYMSEALVAVDRIAEAVEMLLTEEETTDLTSVPPESKSDSDSGKGNDKGEKESYKGPFYPWVISSLSSASAVVQHNLAVSHAMRGEFEKSLSHLNKSFEYMGQPLTAQMCSLRLYLDLIEGRRQMAQVFIKNYFGHTTPNRLELSTMSLGENISQ